MASGRFFFHLGEVFEKCIEHKGRFLVHFQEIKNFLEKVLYFSKILDQLTAHFLESL